MAKDIKTSLLMYIIIFIVTFHVLDFILNLNFNIQSILSYFSFSFTICPIHTYPTITVVKEVSLELFISILDGVLKTVTAHSPVIVTQ